MVKPIVFTFYELTQSELELYRKDVEMLPYVLAKPIIDFLDMYNPTKAWFVSYTHVSEEHSEQLKTFTTELTGEYLLLAEHNIKTVIAEPTGILMLSETDALLAKLRFI